MTATTTEKYGTNVSNVAVGVQTPDGTNGRNRPPDFVEEA